MAKRSVTVDTVPAMPPQRGRRSSPEGDGATRSLRAAVQAALQRAPDSTPGPNARKIDLVADALVTKACAGDVQAIKAVLERIDKKASAEPEEPQKVRIVHSFRSRI